MINADSTLRLADLAVERGCYLPLLPKQRLAADKARREMDGWEDEMTITGTRVRIHRGDR